MFRKLFIFLLLIQEVQGLSSTLIIVNKSSNTVTFFKEDTLEKLAEIPVGFTPHEVAVNKTGNIALVSNYGTKFRPGSTLTILNVETLQVIGIIELPKKSRPHGILFLSDSRALVTTEGIQSLLEVDVDSQKVVRIMKLPGKGSHLLTTDGAQKFAFVANADSGTVCKVELATGTVVAETKIGKAAEGISLTQDESSLLVTNRKDSLIAKIDVASFDVLNKVHTGNGPIRLVLFAGGTKAVFTNSVGGTAQVLDINTFQIVATFKPTEQFSLTNGKTLGGLGGLLPVPITIGVRPDQRTAYIANSFAGNITLVDLATGSILKIFEASQEPDGLAISPVNMNLQKFPQDENEYLMLRESELCAQKVLEQCADLEGFPKSNVLTASVKINAPIEMVWKALMDISSYPKWNSFMPSVQSNLHIGDNLKFTVRLGSNFSQTETVKITLRNEERDLCWGSHPFGSLLVTKRCKHLQELSDGSVLYYTTEKFQGKIANSTLRLVRTSIATGLKQEAKDLLKYIEGQ